MAVFCFVIYTELLIIFNILKKIAKHIVHYWGNIDTLNKCEHKAMNPQPKEKAIEHISILTSAIVNKTMLNDIELATMKRDINLSSDEDVLVTGLGLLYCYMGKLDLVDSTFGKAVYKSGAVANNYLFALARTQQFIKSYSLIKSLKDYDFHLRMGVLSHGIMVSYMFCDAELLSDISKLVKRVGLGETMGILDDKIFNDEAVNEFNDSINQAIVVSGESHENILRNINLAINILHEKKADLLKISLPTEFTPMMTICVDADVQTIVKMNFELTRKLVNLYDGEIKFPIYFSVKSDMWEGVNVKAS